ncbi:MAG: NAD(P)/FAD-dependent oxidoreductase [Candidatus Cohnella colombiensis]|uniref:NAD(P)/FAD-dependent oxidoreductase n=1 Tax=Candidatus Cohnella colombiensis TaxID=3121368 RepID=A0AA95F2Z4_9BACL|nr:MAG: NAD(P)/FAD-dependent oxidoreductase [Cohnella sp.]
MRTDFDAIVIGAGVAGSSMAISLARQGWQVALIDKDSFPRHKACGEFLSPESIVSLKALELDSVIDEFRPPVITTACLHTESVSLSIALPGTAIGLSRYSLDSWLQQKAFEIGVQVYTGSTVSAIVETIIGYVVEISSKEGRVQLSSRTVIAAWGRRPLNRLQAASQKSSSRTYIGIKSHFTCSDCEPIVDLYFFQGGYFGISPIEGGRLNVAALLTHDTFHTLGSPNSVQRIMEYAAKQIPALHSRLESIDLVPGTQAATSPVIIRPQPIAWNEIACIGDAVAVIPPFCGDGMSMALRSVELCSPLANAYLRGDCTKTEWRNTYTEQIKHQFSNPLRWGRILDRLLTNRKLSPILLRLGTFAPGIAEKMVRATRVRG